MQTVYLSADMTQEQQAAWKSALNAAGLDNKDIQFTGNLISEPTPTPDPTPTTPPADNTTAAEAASTPTVQQMEQRERPDPQDVEATERYNFWMGVKADLRAAADGKTLRVHVPADYTNMPASVMEQIRLLDADVTVDLRWNGERLTITPATAQRKTALKAFWTFAQLCELYAHMARADALLCTSPAGPKAPQSPMSGRSALTPGLLSRVEKVGKIRQEPPGSWTPAKGGGSKSVPL